MEKLGGPLIKHDRMWHMAGKSKCKSQFKTQKMSMVWAYFEGQSILSYWLCFGSRIEADDLGWLAFGGD